MDPNAKESILIFSLGCILDHITTAIGLTINNISEMNQIVIKLVEIGAWNAVDIFVVVVCIVLSFSILRSNSNFLQRYTIIALFSSGILRFSAGFHNLNVILKAF